MGQLLGPELHGTQTGRVGEKGQLDIIVMDEILLVSPSQPCYGADTIWGHFIESMVGARQLSSGLHPSFSSLRESSGWTRVSRQGLGPGLGVRPVLG